VGARPWVGMDRGRGDGERSVGNAACARGVTVVDTVIVTL
jgi:hypothetical protein